MTQTDDLWRPVEGFPGFSVSRDGRARRDAFTDKRGYPRYERELVRTKMNGTYRRAGHVARYYRFMNENGSNYVPVEQAIWTTFNGPFEKRTHYLAFKNGQSDDARLENIILKKIQ